MPSDKSRDYSFKECMFPPVLNLGFVQIVSADQLPATTSHVRIEPNETFIRLDTDEVLFALYMFQLPGGEQEFQRVSQFFDERKQRIRLPEGIKFSSEHLAVVDPPISWRHDAWANSKYELFHTYQSADRAMLTRWMGTKAAMLTHPLFAMIRDNLRIRADQWVVEFPGVTTKPDIVRPRSTVPLTEPLQAEIRHASLRASAHLSLAADAAPETVHRAIHDFIDGYRAQDNRPVSKTDELAIDLGALWGDGLCAAAGWQWRTLIENGRSLGTVVCHPSQSHMTNPIRNLHALLKAQPNGKANNALLLFNMIRAGSLPSASPEALINLS